MNQIDAVVKRDELHAGTAAFHCSALLLFALSWRKRRNRLLAALQKHDAFDGIVVVIDRLLARGAAGSLRVTSATSRR